MAHLNSEELECNADDFVECLWEQALNEAAPSLDAPADAWLDDVDNWIRELRNNDKGFISYLCGLLHKAANNWSRSNRFLNTSLSEGLGDFLHVRTYLAMGYNCRDLNELSQATENLDIALKEAATLGLAEEEARALNGLGIVAADRHKYDAAIKLYERATQKAELTGDRELEGKGHGNTGILLKNRNTGNDMIEALVHHVRALHLSREIGDKRSEGRTLGNLGITYSDLGYKQVAEGFYAEAKEVATALGNLLHVAIWLANAGEDALTFDRVLGERLLREAIKAFRDLGKEHLAAQTESLLESGLGDTA